MKPCFKTCVSANVWYFWTRFSLGIGNWNCNQHINISCHVLLYMTHKVHVKVLFSLQAEILFIMLIFFFSQILILYGKNLKWDFRRVRSSKSRVANRSVRSFTWTGGHFRPNGLRRALFWPSRPSGQGPKTAKQINGNALGRQQHSRYYHSTKMSLKWYTAL